MYNEALSRCRKTARQLRLNEHRFEMVFTQEMRRVDRELLLELAIPVSTFLYSHLFTYSRWLRSLILFTSFAAGFPVIQKISAEHINNASVKQVIYAPRYTELTHDQAICFLALLFFLTPSRRQIVDEHAKIRLITGKPAY